MRTHETTVGEVPIRWQEWGSDGGGPPVVLVHGIPTSPALWRHVLPLLDGARALAFEMVGYGSSIAAGVDHDIGVADQADHLVSWLDHIDIDRAVLVGHDLGGGVAQIVAVRHPERVAGLVLTHAISYDSWPIPSVKALRATSPVAERLPTAVVYPVLATLMARGHDDLAMARESLSIHWRPYAQHDGAAALARQASALDVQDTLEVAGDLPQLDLPARIVWGTADQFQEITYGERLAEDLDADLWRIEGGKHFVPEDHPDDVARAITEVRKDL